jgi:hypothetical protein
VLHTAHCARNITLCHLCTEPIPKNQNQFESHKEACPYAVAKQKKKPPPPSPIKLELSSYYREQKAIQDKKAAARKERLIRKYDRMLDPGYKLGSGKPREKCLVCWNFKDDLSHFLGLCLPKDFDSFVPKPPTFEYATAAFSLLPTITTTTTETTHSTSAGTFLFIPRGTVGGSRHQSAGDKKASGDAPVYQFYHGATPRGIFRFGAEQLPRQPPTAVTTASALTQHDTATKPTATNAFSLLPTITTTKETTNSTAAGASLLIPKIWDAHLANINVTDTCKKLEAMKM